MRPTRHRRLGPSEARAGSHPAARAPASPPDGFGRRPTIRKTAQGQRCGVRTARAVDAAAGRRRRRAQEDVGVRGAVAAQANGGPEQQLRSGERAGVDVAADEVAVVGGELRRRGHMASEHHVAEAGGEAFQLRLDRRRGVDHRTVGHVGVCPQGVLARRRPGRVALRRLHGEHERALGHPPGGDVGLRRGHRSERPAEVHRAGPGDGRVGPRHGPVQGVVDLERRRSEPVAPQAGAVRRRQVVPADRGELQRVRVEQGNPVRRQGVERCHRATGDDRAAGLDQSRRQRIDQPLRPTCGERPADRMTRRREHQSERRARTGGRAAGTNAPHSRRTAPPPRRWRTSGRPTSPAARRAARTRPSPAGAAGRAATAAAPTRRCRPSRAPRHRRGAARRGRRARGRRWWRRATGGATPPARRRADGPARSADGRSARRGAPDRASRRSARPRRVCAPSRSGRGRIRAGSARRCGSRHQPCRAPRTP